MPVKRKDHRGRILKEGESQRKDLVYQYRYTDNHGKRRYVYAKDITELRRKEEEIQVEMASGLDYAAGEVTVNELLERYIGLKQGVRYNTKIGYKFVQNLVKQEEFGKQKIRNIRVSDV